MSTAAYDRFLRREDPWMLQEGDCLTEMRTMSADSIDAIVTDPPYGIGFMGHDWDQPGKHGPVRAAGNSTDFASGRRYPGKHVVNGSRRSQPSPTSGAGHARERVPKRKNHHIDGKKREGVRFSGPTGVDNTTHTLRGGAMHAGRYDLSPVANEQFEDWCRVWASEALRIVKPGGFLLVFGGTRTYHRLACGVEDAGWEIRDQLIWLFGSGFPKSRNPLHGMTTLPRSTTRPAWREWHRLARVMSGTALKPGYEPILMARKPLDGTVAANLLEWQVGCLNINGCGIEPQDKMVYESNGSGARGHEGTRTLAQRGATDMRMGGGTPREARWAPNVLLDEEAAVMLDEQSGVLTSGSGVLRRNADKFGRNTYGTFKGTDEVLPPGDSGGASRFFYCAKTSRAERNAGLESFLARPLHWSSGDQSPSTFQSDGTNRTARNFHPTVKPISLMRWLVRLVTPPSGLVLDPFAGSGSTGCAAVLEGFRFLGIEREKDYLPLACARIAWWAGHPEGLSIEVAAQSAARQRASAEAGQSSLFDTVEPV